MLPKCQLSARIKERNALLASRPNDEEWRGGIRGRLAFLWKGERGIMRPGTTVENPAPRPSRLIAEALVQRHGPRRIVRRASRLGFSPRLTHVMVVACGATALQPREADPARLPPFSL